MYFNRAIFLNTNDVVYLSLMAKARPKHCCIFSSSKYLLTGQEALEQIEGEELDKEARWEHIIK